MVDLTTVLVIDIRTLKTWSVTLITPQRSDLASGVVGWQHGQGPALLLIHGVGMRAEYWSNIESELLEHFTLTVIDMPGHGENSPFDAKDPELPVYTDRLARVLTMIDKPVIVVGHSMGALIALDMAVRYKDQVAGIAVLNGVYRRSNEALQSIRARVAELSSLQSTDPSATLERWFGKNPDGINLQSAVACRDWLGKVNHKGYRDAYRAFANADAPSDEMLKRVDCPALFMTGELEPNSTPAMSISMSQLVPDAGCIVVDQARHMMSMTHGPQVVNALKKCFLPSPVGR